MKVLYEPLYLSNHEIILEFEKDIYAETVFDPFENKGTSRTSSWSCQVHRRMKAFPIQL